jgi:hypothetical protein
VRYRTTPQPFSAKLRIDRKLRKKLKKSWVKKAFLASRAGLFLNILEKMPSKRVVI